MQNGLCTTIRLAINRLFWKTAADSPAPAGLFCGRSLHRLKNACAFFYRCRLIGPQS